MGEIYIVPTPIGNLGDFTYRGREILEMVSKIYAEDTRISKKLLKKYEIQTPVFSYHQHNEHKILEALIKEIKEKNINIALISDAGTPGISDPGYLLINKAKENDINVFCLPGATAIIPALVQSSTLITSYPAPVEQAAKRFGIFVIKELFNLNSGFISVAGNNW